MSSRVRLLWVHAFRIVGGTILAPGSVGPGVPMAFREMIGTGSRRRAPRGGRSDRSSRRLHRAIWLVWLFLAIARIDTVNAIVQSLRYDVTFVRPRRELGDRDPLCPGLAGEQPHDLPAAHPAGQPDHRDGNAPMTT